MKTVIHGFVQDQLGGAFSNPPQTGNTMPLALAFNGAAYVAMSIGEGFNQFPLEGVGNSTDDVIETGDPINLPVVNYNYLYDGAQFSRARCASANNLSPTVDIPPGVAIATRPGQWAFNHQPAAGTRATVTRGAGGAGVRNVCTGFGFTLNAVAAITVPVVVNLRDGATGVGTILWTGRYTAPVGTTVALDLSGLNIVGSPNTAMTFEFAAAPAAGDFQCVNIQGYRVAL